MTTLQALLEELDMAAATTNEAQVAYANAALEALKAEERLKDYEAEITADAADKAEHPELTNAALRSGHVAEMMTNPLGEIFRNAYYETLYEKLRAQAEYDHCRRREADLRVIVAALKPEG